MAISSIRIGRCRAAAPSTHWASLCRIVVASRMTLGLTRQQPTVLHTQASGRLRVENTRANDTYSYDRNNPDMCTLQIACWPGSPRGPPMSGSVQAPGRAISAPTVAAPWTIARTSAGLPPTLAYTRDRRNQRFTDQNGERWTSVSPDLTRISRRLASDNSRMSLASVNSPSSNGQSRPSRLLQVDQRFADCTAMSRAAAATSWTLHGQRSAERAATGTPCSGPARRVRERQAAPPTCGHRMRGQQRLQRP